MSFIALNKKELSRYSHHWFWGLCVGNEQKDTLFSAAERLQSNPVERGRIDEQVTRIGQSFWLIRALCWLFNIGNYRLHYYEFQAYMSWQLYQKASVKVPDSAHEAGDLPDVLLVGDRFFIQEFGFMPDWMGNLDWFTERLQPDYLDWDIYEVELNTPFLDSLMNRVFRESTLRDELEEVQPDAVQQQEACKAEKVIVSSEMQVSLVILGLIKNPGDTLLLSELKAAYLKRSRETHPDRTHEDTGAEFSAVSGAYQTLLTLIEQNASGDESDAILIAKMNELRGEMRKEAQSWRDVGQSWRDVGQSWRDIGEKARQQNEQERKQGERIDDLTLGYAKLIEMLSSLEAQLGLPLTFRPDGTAVVAAGVSDEARPNGHASRFFPLSSSGVTVDEPPSTPTASQTLH